MGEVSTRVSALCLAIVAGLLTIVAEDIPKWILWVAIAVGTVGFFWPNIYISLWKYGRGERERVPFTALIVLATVTVGVLLVFRVFGRDAKDAGPVEGPTVDEAPVVESEPPPESEPPHIYVRERSPIELLNVVGNLPPLQDAAYYKKAYDGRWVRWNSIVFLIQGADTGGVGVTVLDRPDLPVMVSMDFPASERPLLESLRTGDRIEYEGKIDGDFYDGLLIRLDDARILRVFPDTTQ